MQSNINDAILCLMPPCFFLSSLQLDILKPRYNEPQYSEFLDIVNKPSSHFEDLLNIVHTFDIGPPQVKCQLLSSSIFDEVNFQHISEMLEFDL